MKKGTTSNCHKDEVAPVENEVTSALVIAMNISGNSSMMRPPMIAVIGFCAAISAWSAIIGAQQFPIKPIRMVTAEAGGANDVTTRLIAQGIAPALGQPVIVDNRGVGAVPGEIVSRAPPDGYTLLVAGSGLWVGPLMQKMPYDGVRDFSAVTMLVRSPLLMVIHPSVAAKSVKELIAVAKARPGELNYGSSPAGSSSHLAGELFKSMAGVNIVRVPYKGNGPALNAMLANQVQLMFIAAGVVSQHINAGRLRGLAVSTAEPTALFPGMPTISAAGVPGYESVSIVGLFAPARTPPALIDRLSREVAIVLKQPDLRKKFFDTGVEVIGDTPEQFGRVLKSEVVKWGDLIRSTGMVAE
jgi:tripartite-type tricarboxylate transporter receptor subunit TctC